jgi:hypothetical protein
MRFHLVGGEDVSVLSKDFGGENEALERIAHLMDERRSLVLRRARYDREEAERTAWWSTWPIWCLCGCR